MSEGDQSALLRCMAKVLCETRADAFGMARRRIVCNTCTRQAAFLLGLQCHIVHARTDKHNRYVYYSLKDG